MFRTFTFSSDCQRYEDCCSLENEDVQCYLVNRGSIVGLILLKTAGKRSFECAQFIKETASVLIPQTYIHTV